MTFHAVIGLRSGSTLLCNILAQNPRFHASSTSFIGAFASTLSQMYTNSGEMRARMRHDERQTNASIKASIRGMVEGWYWHYGNKVIFDKDRSWGMSSLLFSSLFEGKLIFMVRDLRAVFGSIEKHHRRNPWIDFAENSGGKTVQGRLDQLCSANGLIWQVVEGVREALRLCADRCVVIDFNTLCRDPEDTMRKLYAQLGEPYYEEHQFDDVQQANIDDDVMYGMKYPHGGTGKVEPREDDWPLYVPQDLAQTINQRFMLYQQAFGYLPSPQQPMQQPPLLEAASDELA